MQTNGAYIIYMICFQYSEEDLCVSYKTLKVDNSVRKTYIVCATYPSRSAGLNSQTFSKSGTARIPLQQGPL